MAVLSREFEGQIADPRWGCKLENSRIFIEELNLKVNTAVVMDNSSDEYFFSEIDPCTDWIEKHNNSEQFIPKHLELEWAQVCIGHQR